MALCKFDECQWKWNVNESIEENLEHNRSIDNQSHINWICRSLKNKCHFWWDGPAMSGKSTILKQIKYIYQNGIQIDRGTFDNLIYRQTISEICSLMSIDLNSISKSGKFIQRSITSSQKRISSKLAKHLKIVWKDERVQNALRNQNDFKMSESLKYFMNPLKRWRFGPKPPIRSRDWSMSYV